MKCLVVDDSATMRRILRNILRSLGVTEIIEAQDGKQGLERCDGSVGLVTMGWNLGGTSGIELTRRLRSNPETASVRILLLSSRSRKSDVETAIAAGANSYVLKPFVPDTVRQKLEELMHSGNGNAAGGNAAGENAASGNGADENAVGGDDAVQDEAGGDAEDSENARAA